MPNKRAFFGHPTDRLPVSFGEVCNNCVKGFLNTLARFYTRRRLCAKLADAGRLDRIKITMTRRSSQGRLAF